MKWQVGKWQVGKIEPFGTSEFSGPILLTFREKRSTATYLMNSYVVVHFTQQRPQA